MLQLQEEMEIPAKAALPSILKNSLNEISEGGEGMARPR